MSRRWHVPEIVLLAIPGMVILAVSVMQESYAQWSTEWNWAWSQWAAQVQLTAPMTGGLAAWLVYDAMRDGRGDWLATTARGGALLRRRTLAATIPAGVAAIVTGAALPFVLGVSGSVRWPLLPAISMAAAIIGAAAVGGLAARLLPKAVAAPLVVVLLWTVVVGLLPVGTSWLRVGGAGHTLAGYDVVGSLPVHRVIMTTAAVGAAALVLSARRPSRWRWGHQVAAAVAGVTVVGLLLGSGWFRGGTYDIQPDPLAAADACASTSAATICAMPEHAAAVEAARPAIMRVLEARRSLGVDTPDTVRELTPNDVASTDGRSGRDRSQLDFTIDPSSATGPADAAATLVVPAICYAAQDNLAQPQFETSDDAIRVLSIWALTVAGEPVPMSQDDPAWLRFSTLSPAAQGEWLRTAILAADSCRFDEFRAIES